MNKEVGNRKTDTITPQKRNNNSAIGLHFSIKNHSMERK